MVQRRHALSRCCYRGGAGTKRWVGLGIIADNLISMGMTMPSSSVRALTVSLSSTLPTTSPLDFAGRGAPEELTFALESVHSNGSTKSATHRREPTGSDFDRIQVTTAMISASVGKRPIVCLEKAIRPSTRISKTPPPERRRVTCASGRAFRMRVAAARARGS